MSDTQPSMPRAVWTATVAAIAAAGIVSSTARDAAACGGVFAPQGQPTVVTGHRMVLSVSPSRSVLWDQISYSGDPTEFAWVLPVRPGARVEVGTAAFFETLDALTGVRVQPPPVDCGGGTESLGCSSTLSLGALDEASAAPDVEPVDVVHQGTVGPYETVTLSTSTPGALSAWLDGHGYVVDPAAQPVIDAYVAEGFDFIALRLLPGTGITAMTPVRVISPGGGVTLPLRMVAVGAGAETPIVLYVVGESRYRVESLEEVALTRGLLSWDFSDSATNYEVLRERALAQHGGLSFLTTFAGRDFFTREPFFTTYATQAVSNGEAETCSPAFPSSGGLVQQPCPPGEPWDSPACGVVQSGIDARKLGCEDLADLAVAVEGMRLEDVWLTRLEMVLPREGLTADMTLGGAASQRPIDSGVQASIALSATDACPAGMVPRLEGPRRDDDRWPLALLAACGAALLWRARPRAQRRPAARTIA